MRKEAQRDVWLPGGLRPAVPCGPVAGRQQCGLMIRYFYLDTDEFFDHWRGAIAVNRYMQCNSPNIFACGDVARPYQFTYSTLHTAWYAEINVLFGRAVAGVVLLRQFTLGAVLAATGACVVAASESTIGAFSAMSIPNGFEGGWTLTTLPDVNPTQFELIYDDDQIVVKATAKNAAASLMRTVRRDLSAQTSLGWRWRIDRVIEQSDIATKQGDDFAARLYVFFDYPIERMSLVERTKLNLARWWYGDQVPAAALCYVWANREQPGTTAWNAYTSRVRMIVLRNAESEVGHWIDEKRDLAADFRSAFGDITPVVTGIAIAADTDQTDEAVTAWFGDIRFGL